jgi:hypothetical protein
VISLVATEQDAVRVLRAHQVQVLLAAGNQEIDAALVGLNEVRMIPRWPARHYQNTFLAIVWEMHDADEIISVRPFAGKTFI